jgi:hypothetical protein
MVTNEDYKKYFLALAFRSVRRHATSGGAPLGSTDEPSHHPRLTR